MHPYETYVLAQLRHGQALANARAARLSMAARRNRQQARVASWRLSLGYRLVEAGLRVAIGKTAHPPPGHDTGAERSALAR